MTTKTLEKPDAAALPHGKPVLVRTFSAGVHFGYLAHTMLADGRTVGEAIKPQIAEHYRLGGPPSLMLTGPSS